MGSSSWGSAHAVRPFVALMLALVGCADAPVHPRTAGAIVISLDALTPEWAGQATGSASTFTIARVRARIRALGLEAPLLDEELADVDLNARGEGQVVLRFPLAPGGSRVYEALLELRNQTGELLWQVGPVPFDTRADGQPTSLNAEAIYVGPGSDIGNVRVERSAVRVPPGTTATVRCIGVRPGGGDTEQFPRRWESTNPAVVAVDADGVLRGVAPGTATVRCAADIGRGLAPASLHVTVSALPVAFVVVSGRDQTAYPGETLPEQLVGRVVDAGGAGVPGVLLHFAASSGGSVSVDSAVTDAQGLVTARWTLGARPFSDPRTNTLTVSSPELPRSEFSVVVADPCGRTPIAASVGLQRVGQLRTGYSCVLGQRSGDRFAVTLSSATVFHNTVSSASFAPSLFWLSAGGLPQLTGQALSAPGTARGEFAFPAGAYEIFAGNALGDQSSQPVGPYSMSIASIAEPASNCSSDDGVWVLPGTSVSASITDADCVAFDTLVRRDGYRLLLQAGQTVTFTFTADFPFRVNHYINGDFVEQFSDRPAGSTFSHTVTASAPSFHRVRIVNHLAGQYGGYTFNVTPGGAGLRAEHAPGSEFWISTRR